MMFNYAKLRGRIKEIFDTENVFAKNLGISQTSLSQKLNNKVEFTQKEIKKAIELLHIPKEEIPIYFFTVENEINARMDVSDE
jgi:transcriptional regulator with XRE-family HTH domain